MVFNYICVSGVKMSRECTEILPKSETRKLFADIDLEEVSPGNSNRVQAIMDHYPLPLLLAAANNSDDPLLLDFSLAHQHHIQPGRSHLDQGQSEASTSGTQQFAPQNLNPPDEDGDKHVIARGLARLPEAYAQSDLDLLFRTLANEASFSRPQTVSTLCVCVLCHGPRANIDRLYLLV